MFAWAAGRDPGRADRGSLLRPRQGARVAGPGGDVWVSGFQERHVRSVQGDDPELMVTVVGNCLSLDSELRACLALSGTARWRALAMLPGSFRTIVRSPSETVVIGDLVGLACLYFVVIRGRLVWATAATPLAAYLDSGPRLEPVVLDMAVSGIPRFGGETPYEGVNAVRPGWLLRIAADGHRTERWYEPSEFVTYEHARSRFREWLLEAVRRRAQRSPSLTADLSGGIDSSTVAVLAARHRDLVAFTYLDDPQAEDLAFAVRIAAGTRRLSHRVVGIDQRTLHYCGLDDPAGLPRTDLPSEAVAVIGPDRAILEQAAGTGSSDHLTGWGGDLVLSAGPGSLVGLLRSGQPLRALGGALMEARAQRSSATRVSLATLRLTADSYGRSLRRAARALRAARVDPAAEPEAWRLALNWSRPLAAAGWLTRDAAAQVSQRLERLANETPDYAHPEQSLDWWEATRSAASTAAIRAVAWNLGIEHFTPFWHNRILDLCLSLPGYVREPAGSFKPLVRTGLADLLPPALAERDYKDGLVQTNTAHQGLRRHARALRELIASDSSALIKAGMFERRLVSARLEEMIDGSDMNTTSLRKLIAAEIWLAQQDLRRETWWTEELT